MARSLADRQRAHEQQKARLAEQEAKIKLAERKARTKRLIEAGANLDIGKELGMSALLLACVAKRAATALLLIEAGAGINLVSAAGSTALDKADNEGLSTVSAALRARGARGEVRRVPRASAAAEGAARGAGEGSARPRGREQDGFEGDAQVKKRGEGERERRSM